MCWLLKLYGFIWVFDIWVKFEFLEFSTLEYSSSQLLLDLNLTSRFIYDFQELGLDSSWNLLESLI